MLGSIQGTRDGTPTMNHFTYLYKKGRPFFQIRSSGIVSTFLLVEQDSPNAVEFPCSPWAHCFYRCTDSIFLLATCCRTFGSVGKSRSHSISTSTPDRWRSRYFVFGLSCGVDCGRTLSMPRCTQKILIYRQLLRALHARLPRISPTTGLQSCTSVLETVLINAFLRYQMWVLTVLLGE